MSGTVFVGFKLAQEALKLKANLASKTEPEFLPFISPGLKLFFA